MTKNIAVIGSGYWGKNLIRNFYELGALKYIYDESKDSRKEQQKIYGIKDISFEEILEDKEVQGVVISTPAETHFKIAKKCIHHEKNVFIEKPMCLNLEDAIDLREISRDRGKIIMVGHLLNYNDHFIKLLELADDKSLGALKKIKSSRKSFGKLRKNENVIWSFAPHDISMINRIVSGQIENLKVIKKSFFNKNCDAAILTYKKSGVCIEIDVDWTSIDKIHKLELFYENGILIFEDSAPDPNKKLYKIETNFNEEILMNKADLRKEYFSINSNQPLKNECSHFLDCIERNSNPITNSDESIAVLKTLIESDGI